MSSVPTAKGHLWASLACPLVILGACIVLYLVAASSKDTETRRRVTSHRIIINRVKDTRCIADFTVFNARSLEERLHLRAKPNARLVHAFGLNNSFTTTTKDVHTQFVKRAKDAIQACGTDDWRRFSEVTKRILNSSIDYFSDELPYLPLAHMVRIMSFGLVLHALFDVEPSEIDVQDARTATEAINRLWAQSKECGSAPSPYDKKRLDNALRRLLPQHYPSVTTEGNPLNLIMPAYETLWRVVLLTFVSVTGRGVDPSTSKEFLQAINNVPGCLNRNDDAERHALAIAKEGLRLYPPTRRIHRATSTAEGEDDIAAADVEACHRYTEIWGPDAHRFLPTRFHGWSRKKKVASNERHPEPSAAAAAPWDQRFSYFPFGVGKHVCPAGAGFGERIITLLVVELARRFGTSETTGLVIHFGNAESKESRMELLPTGRHDTESWVLELGTK